MNKKLLHCRFKHPEAEVQLLCFPWIGAGSMFYANWGRLFPSSVEVYGVCLPGREYRMGEPGYADLTLLLDDAVQAIHSQCSDKPFAFWGHSFGALLALLVACKMKVRYDLEPKRMFISGVSAPHSGKRHDSGVGAPHPKTDEEVIDFLRKLGGTPVEVLENKDMMRLFLPAIKKDFDIINQISSEIPNGGWPLTCPLDVFHGREDAQFDLESWRDVTSGNYSVTLMDGGHFYIKDPANTSILKQHITTSLT